jgi:glycosyltransferase involved in cell wall biosynthesis
MRILHLDAGKEMRGGQWQALRLIEGLEAAGVESTLLARAGYPLFQSARKQGWRVEPLGLTRALMMVRDHDLIHAHDARAHTMGVLLRGAPLVVARRVAFPVGPGLSSKWKYGRARHYIAVSEFVKGVLVRGGVAAEKISVVYDGVPLLEAEADRRTVLAPANQDDPAKGAPLAMEAARLAGVELKLSSDLQRDLPRAAIFVYITHSEGLGSGVLLAMGAGTAVVASKVGGLTEAIHHGHNGLLVENTPEAVGGAIRELHDNPELSLRLGLAARATVRQRFTVEEMVARTRQVYEGVIS